MKTVLEMKTLWTRLKKKMKKTKKMVCVAERTMRTKMAIESSPKERLTHLLNWLFVAIAVADADSTLD